MTNMPRRSNQHDKSMNCKVLRSSGSRDNSFVEKTKRKYTNNRAEGNLLHKKGETPVIDQHKREISTVSCEKNHASQVVSVLSNDGDAVMRIVSTPGESEKTKVVKKKSKKRKRKCSECHADAMKKVTIDPSGSLDSSISILINAEVTVLDSTVSREKSHTSSVVSVLNKDGDTEMKIVSTPEGSDKTEAAKTNFRRKKRKRSKRPAIATKKVTESASKSLNQRSEAEIGHVDVVTKQVKQDGEGLVIETSEIPTSAGKNAVEVDVIVSDSTISCENNHASPPVRASKEPSLKRPRDFSIDQPVQQHEKKNKELISEIQNYIQPVMPVLQDEHVCIDDSSSFSMLRSDSLSRGGTSVSKRKLLVMDMNGILVDVAWKSPRHPKPDITVSKKGVYKRPFCDDFLEFCFERFDVGIWSSRIRVNLDKIVDFVMGDSKKRLRFCWDQSHCTQTGFNTRENRQKPLVLKELRKLWEKQVEDLPWERGYYNETNTVLLDDSPYKALRNPPNTAIFLHPYSCCEMVDDQSLGPDGELRKYLIRLSEAENVQKFIKENPFGQDPITESSRCWHFYRQIAKPTRLSLHGRKGSNGPPLKKYTSSGGAAALDKSGSADRALTLKGGMKHKKSNKDRPL